MNLKNKLQYLGYLKTPLLWGNKSLLGLDQLKVECTSDADNKPIEPTKKLRLGHLVEQFVFHNLSLIPSIELLAKNIQVKKAKQTIGELDCLLISHTIPIHLEIVYKFYLYDESVGYTELEHWIGPNRKDSFIEKITKLKHKQLPLLFQPETQQILADLHLNLSEIKQRIHFKAQLFVPYHLLHTSLRVINNNCIVGYYLNFKNLNTLADKQFYLPEKLDWLTIPHAEVEWLSFNLAEQYVLNFIAQEKSPLCWVKSSDGTLQKLFVVWW
jgi:hypothetical protein